MKTILIIISFISSYAFAGEITTRSLYTYDCSIAAGESSTQFKVSTFSLAQEFQKGLIINFADRVNRSEISVNDENQKEYTLYSGAIQSLSVSGVSIALSSSMQSGVGSGSVILIHGGRPYTFNCSLNWSPY